MTERNSNRGAETGSGPSSSVEKAARRLAQQDDSSDREAAGRSRRGSIEKSVEAAPGDFEAPVAPAVPVSGTDSGTSPMPAAPTPPAQTPPVPTPSADLPAESPQESPGLDGPVGDATPAENSSAAAAEPPVPQAPPPSPPPSPPPPPEPQQADPAHGDDEPVRPAVEATPDPAPAEAVAEEAVAPPAEPQRGTAHLADRYRDPAPAPAAQVAAPAAPGADVPVADVAEEAEDDEDAEEDRPRRKRRGVFGLLWAIIRFLLIGNKPKKKTKKKRAKQKAGGTARGGKLSASRLRGPRLPGVKLPGVKLSGLAAAGRGGARRLRLVGRLLRRLGFGRVFRVVIRLLPSRIAAKLVAASGDRKVGQADAPLDAHAVRYRSAAGQFRRPLDLSRHEGRTVEIDVDSLRAAGMVTPFGERSQIAEEFRLIKRPLLLNAFESGGNAIRNGNVIMVASSRAGEGKTFTAINLAMSIATERDLTVLLIDADVAKPDVANVLGFEAEIGLIDLIADDSLEIADVILRTSIENFSVIPAGRPHHLATELLASERMARMVTELSQRYPERVIVMDSPPALQSSVAGVLALNVGQILFVVESERTSQTALDNALGLVSACKNINLLLNKTRHIGGGERFGAGYGGYY